ncbi:hypothetical protein BD779DRAFT_657778 [Infundibulicybe gibba]|nr:hypothetical protein BD779DRAFT_657778 [Infundibulicybe gibba]
MGAGSSKSLRPKHKSYPFSQPGYPQPYNSAYGAGYTGYAPAFVPPGYGPPFVPTQSYAPGFPVPAPAQPAHQSTKRKKTKRSRVESAGVFPPGFQPTYGTETQPPLRSRAPEFQQTHNAEARPHGTVIGVYPPEFQPPRNAEVQPPISSHVGMTRQRAVRVQEPVVPPPPIIASTQHMPRPVYADNDAPPHRPTHNDAPPPPPLFTPRTRAPLTGFPSPQVGQASGRRAQTPFNPPMAIHPDDTEDGSEQSHSHHPHQHYQFDQRQHQSSSHHDHEPDASHIPVASDAYGPPPVLGSTFNQDPLSRNPLPTPPRDLYDLTPYKSLINLPHGTALLTAAYAQNPQRSRTLNRPKKKERKGLFRSLTSRRRDEEEDEMVYDEPSVRYVPVFVPAQSQPLGHNGEGSSTGFPMPAPSPAPGPSQTQPTNAASDSSHVRFNQQSRFAGFMNHSPHRVLYANKTYPSATHLHEALKYLDHRPDLAERIRTCQNIKMCIHFLPASSTTNARTGATFS